MKITASAKDGIGTTATCEVIVQGEIIITSVALRETEMAVGVGKTRKIETIITPENPTIKTITWTSSDTDVVTVNENGEITGVRKTTDEENIKVIGTTDDGSDITVECKIIVVEQFVETIEIKDEKEPSNSTSTIEIEETRQ